MLDTPQNASLRPFEKVMEEDTQSLAKSSRSSFEIFLFCGQKDLLQFSVLHRRCRRACPVSDWTETIYINHAVSIASTSSSPIDEERKSLQ